MTGFAAALGEGFGGQTLLRFIGWDQRGDGFVEFMRARGVLRITDNLDLVGKPCAQSRGVDQAFGNSRGQGSRRRGFETGQDCAKAGGAKNVEGILLAELSQDGLGGITEDRLSPGVGRRAGRKLEGGH